MGDSILMQDAGGDGRAVATRAMHGNAMVAGDFRDAFLQMVEWDVDAAGDVLACPLARISDIQQ